jgi:hypothetical protein
MGFCARQKPFFSTEMTFGTLKIMNRKIRGGCV